MNQIIKDVVSDLDAHGCGFKAFIKPGIVQAFKSHFTFYVSSYSYRHM